MSSVQDAPHVSICTPTFNRRPFIPQLIKCIESQDYPADKIEWIVIDDGTDPIDDLLATSRINRIKYYYYNVKMSLGKKRNLMHTKCSGNIIIYMDDDDFYPPTRISHAVATLAENPSCLIAGCNEMYIYYHSCNSLYHCGPYGKNHSTAASFAFRRELLSTTSYDEAKEFTEEKDFLKNYTVPLVQLDPIKTILVFAHDHNTLDKEKLKTNAARSKTCVSTKSVTDFSIPDDAIRFYTHDVHKILKAYELGEIKHKPKIVDAISESNIYRSSVVDAYDQKLAAQTCVITKCIDKIKRLNSIIDEMKNV